MKKFKKGDRVISTPQKLCGDRRLSGTVLDSYEIDFAEPRCEIGEGGGTIVHVLVMGASNGFPKTTIGMMWAFGEPELDFA